MRIKELVEAVPVGSTTQPVQPPAVPGKPPTTPVQPPAVPGQPPAVPGKPPTTPGQPPAVPGQPPAVPGKPPTTPGQLPQPTLGNQQPNATAAAPAKPSPEVQQGMQAMSDQFNALKLKYDELQKQILNPAA